MKLTCGILLILLLGTPAWAAPWVCSLQDTVRVDRSAVRLADVAQGDLPAHVADLVVTAAPVPGETTVLHQRSILRQLVTSGLASGVRFQGASRVVVIRGGGRLDRESLRARTRHLLLGLMPADEPGAPAGSFELEFPGTLPAVEETTGDLTIRPASMLEPGRNHRVLVVHSRGRRVEIPMTIEVHHFREVARARLRVERGDPLLPGIFHWEWVDVGESRQKTDLFGREALAGACSARTLQSGDYLRSADLKAIPVIRAGDRVELKLQRGAVVVSVPATARQEGPIGKVIPVRNELTQRLINARITGPGSVEWRN